MTKPTQLCTQRGHQLQQGLALAAGREQGHIATKIEPEDVEDSTFGGKIFTSGVTELTGKVRRELQIGHGRDKGEMLLHSELVRV